MPEDKDNSGSESSWDGDSSEISEVSELVNEYGEDCNCKKCIEYSPLQSDSNELNYYIDRKLKRSISKGSVIKTWDILHPSNLKDANFQQNILIKHMIKSKKMMLSNNILPKRRLAYKKIYDILISCYYRQNVYLLTEIIPELKTINTYSQGNLHKDDINYLIKMYIYLRKILFDKYFHYIYKYENELDDNIIVENYKIILKINKRDKIVNSIKNNVNVLNIKYKLIFASESPSYISKYLLKNLTIENIMDNIDKYKLYKDTAVYKKIINYLINETLMDKIELCKYYFLFLSKDLSPEDTQYNEIYETLDEIDDDFYIQMSKIMRKIHLLNDN